MKNQAFEDASIADESSSKTSEKPSLSRELLGLPVIVAAELFGTNLRTTVSNSIRGAIILLTNLVFTSKSGIGSHQQCASCRSIHYADRYHCALEFGRDFSQRP